MTNQSDPSAQPTRETPGGELSVDELMQILAAGMAGEVERINAEAVAAAADATVRSAWWWEAAKHYARSARRLGTAAGNNAIERNHQRRRAEAAEADRDTWKHRANRDARILADKLAETDVRLTAERDLALWLHAEAKWKHANEHAANTTLGFGLLQLERERDEARAKLVEISDLIGDDDPCFDHANNCDSHNILNQVREVTAAYFADPATDRGDDDPERFCSRCCAGVDSPEHHEKCVLPGRAELGESAPGREEPVLDYDALYDAIGAELDRRLNRALQQLDTRHEAIHAAITVLRPDARASEEPAGETKPTADEIDRCHEATEYGHTCRVCQAPPIAHGQVVEHQAEEGE